MPNDPTKTVVTTYMALAIKGDVLDRKAEYARVPVLKNLLPAQVLMGNSSFNTGNSISAGLPVYARNRITTFADALAKRRGVRLASLTCRDCRWSAGSAACRR